MVWGPAVLTFLRPLLSLQQGHPCSRWSKYHKRRRNHKTKFHILKVMFTCDWAAQTRKWKCIRAERGIYTRHKDSCFSLEWSMWVSVWFITKAGVGLTSQEVYVGLTHHTAYSKKLRTIACILPCAATVYGVLRKPNPLKQHYFVLRRHKQSTWTTQVC